MKLDAYLARSGMTLQGFGKRVGVSHSTVQRWASGRSAPRGRAAMEAVVAAKAVEKALRAEKERRWIKENRAAMDAWNAWTDANELPLAKYRAF